MLLYFLPFPVAEERVISERYLRVHYKSADCNNCLAYEGNSQEGRKDIYIAQKMEQKIEGAN